MNLFIINQLSSLLKKLKIVIDFIYPRLTKYEIFFNQSGFFEVPDKVEIIYVTACAGGGGGRGFWNGAHIGGGGGGSGAFCINFPLKVIPHEIISIIVGAGGTTGAPGNSGGNTTFKNIVLGGGQPGGVTDAYKGGDGGSVWVFGGGNGGGFRSNGSNGGFLINKTSEYNSTNIQNYLDIYKFAFLFPGAGGGGASYSSGSDAGNYSGYGGKCGNPSSYNLPNTPIYSDFPGGDNAADQAGGGGGSTPWGKGGGGGHTLLQGSPPYYYATPCTGYGSGGGGIGIWSWPGYVGGGDGAPGFVTITYYVPSKGG